MTRLSFSLYTTSYLGNIETGIFCVDVLKKRLPKVFWPTKFKDHTFKSHKFSLDDPQELLTRFPGNFENDGYISLNKIKGKFSFYLFWRRSSQDRLATTPGYKFCNIGMTFENGEEIISDQKLFDTVRGIWLELCEHFNTVFGYTKYDVIGMEEDGWGLGRCLPRLHWFTYLGTEYVRDFGLNHSTSIKNCDIYVLTRGMLLELQGEPLSLRYPNSLEEQIINQFGKEYFWDYLDDRANPCFPYKLPELDLSEVQIGNGKLDIPIEVETFTAANPNYKRRDEILQLNTDWELHKYLDFDSLDLKGLEELIAEGFVDPSIGINNMPPLKDFFEFITRYPSIKLGGRVNNPTGKRPRYDTIIDRLIVMKNDVTEELRKDFLDFCNTADEIKTVNGLFSWWD